MITLNKLRQNLIYQFNSEHEELEAIREVFEVFNFQRDKLEDYVLNKRHVAAYTLYYASTNYQKWTAAISRLDQKIKDEILANNIIEIGCGPATFAMAFRDWIQSHDLNFKKHWYGVDSSELMLEQANQLVQEDFISFQKNVSDVQSPVLFFSHSLNEMKINEIEALIEKYNPRLVIWIEPGTKEFFAKALEIRNKLLSRQFQVITPCLNSGKCPAGLVEGEWCHQIFEVKHSICVERLCQKLSRDRRSMPVSFHVYSRSENQKTSEMTATLFRKKKKTKHSFEWVVCLDDDGLELIEFEVSLRGLSKAQMKSLDSFQVGEIIDFEVLKKINDCRWRVGNIQRRAATF